MNWRDRAACRDMPTGQFFPERGDNASVTAARAVCNGCPVTAECLDYALKHVIRQGVWGGHSEEERKALRRQYLRTTVCRKCGEPFHFRFKPGYGSAPPCYCGPCGPGSRPAIDFADCIAPLADTRFLRKETA